jgi:hypothetical protein
MVRDDEASEDEWETAGAVRGNELAAACAETEWRDQRPLSPRH